MLSNSNNNFQSPSSSKKEGDGGSSYLPFYTVYTAENGLDYSPLKLNEEGSESESESGTSSVPAKRISYSEEEDPRASTPTRTGLAGDEGRLSLQTPRRSSFLPPRDSEPRFSYIPRPSTSRRSLVGYLHNPTEQLTLTDFIFDTLTALISISEESKEKREVFLRELEVFLSTANYETERLNLVLQKFRQDSQINQAACQLADYSIMEEELKEAFAKGFKREVYWYQLIDFVRTSDEQVPINTIIVSKITSIAEMVAKEYKTLLISYLQFKAKHERLAEKIEQNESLGLEENFTIFDDISLESYINHITEAYLGFVSEECCGYKVDQAILDQEKQNCLEYLNQVRQVMGTSRESKENFREKKNKELTLLDDLFSKDVTQDFHSQHQVRNLIGEKVKAKYSVLTEQRRQEISDSSIDFEKKHTEGNDGKTILDLALDDAVLSGDFTAVQLAFDFITTKKPEDFPRILSSALENLTSHSTDYKRILYLTIGEHALFHPMLVKQLSQVNLNLRSISTETYAYFPMLFNANGIFHQEALTALLTEAITLSSPGFIEHILRYAKKHFENIDILTAGLHAAGNTPVQKKALTLGIYLYHPEKGGLYDPNLRLSLALSHHDFKANFLVTSDMEKDLLTMAGKETLEVFLNFLVESRFPQDRGLSRSDIDERQKIRAGLIKACLKQADSSDATYFREKLNINVEKVQIAWALVWQFRDVIRFFHQQKDNESSRNLAILKSLIQSSAEKSIDPEAARKHIGNSLSTSLVIGNPSALAKKIPTAYVNDQPALDFNAIAIEQIPMTQQDMSDYIDRMILLLGPFKKALSDTQDHDACLAYIVSGESSALVNYLQSHSKGILRFFKGPNKNKANIMLPNPGL